MKHTPVKSSNITSVRYDENKQLLEVTFTSGSTYQYSDVPIEKHKALMAADSHGKHFLANIKGQHAFKKV